MCLRLVPADFAARDQAVMGCRRRTGRICGQEPCWIIEAFRDCGPHRSTIDVCSQQKSISDDRLYADAWGLARRDGSVPSGPQDPEGCPSGCQTGYQDHLECLKIILICSDLVKQCAIRDSNPEPAEKRASLTQ